jgi:hypothetical protein
MLLGRPGVHTTPECNTGAGGNAALRLWPCACGAPCLTSMRLHRVALAVVEVACRGKHVSEWLARALCGSLGACKVGVTTAHSAAISASDLVL